MSKFKMTALATLLLSGAAFAEPACNNFQVKLKNNLADDLLVSNITLTGANIQPGNFETLKAKTEQVFTINGSTEQIGMDGEFSLHTISLPSKTVKIRYTLINKGPICEHTDYSPAGDYSVEKTRGVGEVKYSINN